MPEIKNNFSQGKMNKDLDERLIPKGQYRDAMNIQVSTSEGSDVGTAQNILGNAKVENIIGGNWNAVGTIADEKNNKLYWLAHNATRDAIFEYNLEDNTTVPVIIDNNMDVLKFNGSLITGINIVDDILMWTDNVNEPRKINITRCKLGADATSPNSTHTKLVVNGSTSVKEVTTFWTQAFSNTSAGTNELFLSGIGTSLDPKVKVGDNLIEFQAGSSDDIFNPLDKVVTAVDYSSGKVTINTDIYNGLGNASVGQYVKFGIVKPLEEKHITVVKKRPSIPPQIEISKFATLVPTEVTAALSQGNNGQFLVVAGDTVEIRVPRINTNGIVFSVGFNAIVGDTVLLSQSLIQGALPSSADLTGVVTNIVQTVGNPGYHTFTLDVTSILANLPTTVTTFDGNNIDTGLTMNAVVRSELSGSLFSERLVRFGTRWKYEDGEYSAFSPFTEVAFNAGTFSFHPTKDTFNLGMLNNCQSIKLSKLVPPNIPEDVVQIDILFKLENSNTIYSIDSIKPNDPKASNSDILNNWYKKTDENVTISIPQSPFFSSNVDLSGSYSGIYNITTENIYAALPSNQLLRPWDNVPKKALAQEITGNRIVYGNYKQGYSMLDGNKTVKPKISVDYRQRSLFGDESLVFNEGRKSLKTFKNYQIGVVYGDEYGRETPVFSSQNASLKIPWDADHSTIFNGNASRSTQLTARLEGDQPDFASYYKFFVKQTSGEYYNLTMDKIYRSEDEENLWISFPSSDVNKVQEGEYIILKKQVDVNAQVDTNNKYKIIDIKNEAPDFIKFDFNNVGTVGGTDTIVQDLFVGYSTGVNVPEKNNNQIEIKKSTWTTLGGSDLVEIDDKLQLVFTKVDGSSVLQSQTYEISTISLTNNDSNYLITLNKSISISDDWVLSDQNNVIVEHTLRIKISKKVPKDGDEFQGRFFVKIISDLTAKQYLESLIFNEIIYRNSASFDAYYFADEQTAANSGASANDGVVNATNTTRYNASGDPKSLHTENKSNTLAAWQTLYEFGLTSPTPNWFIDQAYFAGVQPLDTSDPSGETGLLGVGESGRFHIGAGGPNGQYFVDSIEGMVNTLTSGAAYSNHGSSVNSSSGWGARTWTYKRRGHHNPISFPDNEVDDIYTGGQNYMHISFGPVGEALWKPSEPRHWSGHTHKQGGFWQAIDPGIFMEDYATNHGLPGTSSQNFKWHNTMLPYINSSTGTSPGGSDGVESPECLGQWKIQDPLMAQIASKFRTKGSQFRFDNFEEVFTITNFRVKRLYNHTAFRKTQNAWDGSVANNSIRPKSVEELFRDWVISVGGNSSNSHGASVADPPNSEAQLLYNALEAFGDPSNRRLLYILELDKNPADFFQTSDFVFDVDTLQGLRFVEPTVVAGDTSPTISPAIWETELKNEADLNIYYEASQAIPLKLNSSKENSEMYAPIGSKVWSSKSGSMPILNDFPFVVTNWEQDSNGNYSVVEMFPGLQVDTSVAHTNSSTTEQTNVFSGKTLRFFKPDGSYVSSRISEVINIQGGSNSKHITKVRVGTFNFSKTIGLSYYDCFSFGNGVESNRIRDDFNAMTISKGVKASAVLEQEYKEEHKKSGLIYSGIYNSTSGVNNLNQFIAAEKITKDLNPTFGSIQKLFQRRVDLISFCEDKVVKILSNKDALYNADGNSQLISTNRVLGDANPFVGDYGISKNPESFAKESYRSYFTDKQRGAVLRLSMDGITPISEAGMSDYFKDTLKGASSIIGSYDGYKRHYNLTINNETISYSEKVKGWTSFKSFIPELGISCSNEYYTFDAGQPYKHHVTESPINQSAVNRNTFYQNALVPSTITSVINDQPSLIKSFNTVNYEGNGGWINAVVTTDQQSGTVADFIKKEGKFFNYIKGKAGDVDLQAFNFQGIGQTIGIEYNI